jgi:aerobic carbon-monoxide dehydrogenase medium subunit
VKPAPFQYHAPGTVAEAVDLLANLGEDAKVLAGGQSLIPMLALRLTAFDHLIDIGRIDEMKGIHRDDGALRVGAGTTEAEVGSSETARSSVPLLARATPLIGHFQIRNRGTLGGSVAHADPAAEYPAVALALDARMETMSPRGRRSITAGDFFQGLWTTSMEADELLVAVSFPVWSGRTGFAIEEIARRHGDFAVAGAAVGVELDTDDRIPRCGIALIGLGPTPLRASGAEAEVTGRPVAEVSAEEVGHLAVTGLQSVPADLHGTVEYRKRVGAVMVARAWASALTEAGHEMRWR